MRVQVMITPELSEKIDDLAGRLRISRSEFLAALMEAAVSDNELVIKLVTSEFMEPARNLLQWVKNRKTKGGQTNTRLA